MQLIIAEYLIFKFFKLHATKHNHFVGYLYNTALHFLSPILIYLYHTNYSALNIN